MNFLKLLTLVSLLTSFTTLANTSEAQDQAKWSNKELLGATAAVYFDPKMIINGKEYFIYSNSSMFEEHHLSYFCAIAENNTSSTNRNYLNTFVHGKDVAIAELLYDRVGQLIDAGTYKVVKTIVCSTDPKNSSAGNNFYPEILDETQDSITYGANTHFKLPLKIKMGPSNVNQFQSDAISTYAFEVSSIDPWESGEFFCKTAGQNEVLQVSFGPKKQFNYDYFIRNSRGSYLDYINYENQYFDTQEWFVKCKK